MKKHLVLLLSAFLLVSLLAAGGCGKKETPPAAETTQNTPPTGQQQPADKPAEANQQTAPAADKPAADKPAEDKSKDASKTDAPKPAAPEKTPFEAYLDTLPGKFNPNNAQGVSCVYQFNITDGHPGKYWVKINDGKCTVGKGVQPNPSISINVGEQLWLDIAANKVNGTMAFLSKKFTAEGDTDYLSNMKKYFSK